MSVIFISCSAAPDIESEFINNENENKTIKNTIENLAASIIWSDELQEDALNKEISDSDGISLSVKLNIDNIYSLQKKYRPEAVLPYISGLGSLDLSNTNSTLKAFLIDFCDMMCSSKISYKHVKN